MEVAARAVLNVQFGGTQHPCVRAFPPGRAISSPLSGLRSPPHPRAAVHCQLCTVPDGVPRAQVVVSGFLYECRFCGVCRWLLLGLSSGPLLESCRHRACCGWWPSSCVPRWVAASFCVSSFVQTPAFTSWSGIVGSQGNSGVMPGWVAVVAMQLCQFTRGH